MVWFGDVGAGIWREEKLAWGHKTAVGTPEIVENWWYGAAVHVAANYEVEIGEKWLNVGVIDVDRRMGESDFSFVGWKIVN